MKKLIKKITGSQANTKHSPVSCQDAQQLNSENDSAIVNQYNIIKTESLENYKLQKSYLDKAINLLELAVLDNKNAVSNIKLAVNLFTHTKAYTTAHLSRDYSTGELIDRIKDNDIRLKYISESKKLSNRFRYLQDLVYLHLGMIYRYGYGDILIDEERALLFFSDSCDINYHELHGIKSHFSFPRIFVIEMEIEMNTEKTPKDSEICRRLRSYIDSCELEMPEGSNQYQYEHGIKSRIIPTTKECYLAATHDLGCLYEYGLYGCRKDIAMANDYYEKAENKGSEFTRGKFAFTRKNKTGIYYKDSPNVQMGRVVAEELTSSSSYGSRCKP